MSQVVVHNGVVYTAGQVAQGAPGGTIAEQTADILNSLDTLLEKAGNDQSKLISATIWITDMSDFAAMNLVWDAWVSPGNTPGRACVEARLAAPQFNVEIAVIAAAD